MPQIQNFYKATITKNWTATTGDFNVSVAPTVSSGWLVVSANNSTLREIIYYTATGSNSFGPFITISSIGDRGIGGTTAQIHSIGESVRMNLTAEQWNTVPSIYTGTAAPVTTPTKIGDMFIDTTNHKVYISDGVASSTNWRIMN